MLRSLAVAVMLLSASLCAAQQTMTCVQIASGLSQPVLVTHAPGDRSRLFVVEKRGTIKILRDGQVLPTAFLDIESQVDDLGESGLLGLAFAPDYSASGVFYIFYTRKSSGGGTVPSGAVIARGHVSANADVADPASLQLVNFAARSAGVHNGGWIGFGPDGCLYATLGETGSSVLAQNLTVAHGKVLRIDVTSGIDDFPADPNRNFHIPPGNPVWAPIGALPEIFAYGLRNPWRCSIDPVTGDLWIGDVGGNTTGEVDLLPAGSGGGQNFGWPCFDSLTPGANINQCGGNAALITQGLWTYPRTFGNAITGGYIYRGCAIPAAKGLYFFADYGGGYVWTLAYTPGAPVAAADVVDRTTELRPTVATGFSQFSAFGEDADGELYLCNIGGRIFKIVPRPGTYRDANANGIPDGCEAPFCGPADVASLGGGGGPDNQLTVDDIVAYLGAFFANDLAVADLAGLGGTPGGDGQLTPDDLVAFLDAFFAGCP